MFDFFMKKSEVVLDCFTYEPHVYEYAKIANAIKHVPDWWKKTKKIENNMPTVKGCVAFVEYYKKGIVIPSWFEMDFEIQEENNCENIAYKWQSSFNLDFEQSHSSQQFSSFCNNNGQNLKINSPWAFKSKDDIHFTWTQPTWNMRSNLSSLHVLPGVTNFKYQHMTHINYFFEKKKEKQFCKISALDPLIILHPMTEKNIVIKNHLLSYDEWTKLFMLEALVLNKGNQNILNQYKKKKKIIDFIEKKCPFNFGD